MLCTSEQVQLGKLLQAGVGRFARAFVRRVKYVIAMYLRAQSPITSREIIKVRNTSVKRTLYN